MTTPKGYDHCTAADTQNDAAGHDPARLAETTFDDRYAQWEQAGKPAHRWQPLVPGATSCWQCGHPEESAVHRGDDDREYDVRCVIDITAPDPVAAARKALRTQRAASPWATVFIVTELGDHGAQWRVDLDPRENTVEVLRTREAARLIAGTGLDTATGPGDPDALARIRALLSALGEARQALAGDNSAAARDALYGLAGAVAAFTGESAPGQPAGQEMGDQ